MIRRGARGFTVIELLVVSLIIGILAAIGIPQYVRTLESSKADDAVALVQMIATANRMYASDNGFAYLEGAMTTVAPGGCNTCADGACGPYKLIKCNYLASQDWTGRPYQYFSQNASGSASCASSFPSGSCPAGWDASGLVACGKRKDRKNFPSEGAKFPYSGWAYAVDRNGIVCAIGTGVPPPP